MNYDDLTAEQKAKARNAKTPEEILALAKEEGYELSDDELEAVSGGGWGCNCKGQAVDPSIPIHVEPGPSDINIIK